MLEKPIAFVHLTPDRTPLHPAMPIEDLANRYTGTASR
jgi:hypothetical protein